MTGKKGVKRKMLTSYWFASVIRVKPEGDVNILRLTPFFCPKMLKSYWFASVIRVKPEGDVNILRLTPFFLPC